MARDRGPRPLGRPRDREIDVRVLDATRQLLVEKGYDATTVRAVSERSGEHPSAIYRRWPSRVEIIEEAVFPGLSPIAVRPTGDLRRDLRRFIRAYLAAFGSPEARAAIPGLLASYQSTGRSGAPEAWIAPSARSQFLRLIRAGELDDVDPGVDPDDVFDVLLGAILARVLVPTVAARHRPAELLVESALRLLRPGPAAGPGS